MNWFVNGLIAAIFLGTYNFLYALLPKNISIASILIGVGTGIVIIGLAFGLSGKSYNFEFSQIWWLPFIIGMFLALGVVFVMRAFADPKVSVSQLVPILNTNTLFSVLLGLVILKEYQTASIPKIFLGTLLILLGALVIK